MSKKITYSLLDSITTPAAKRAYPYLGIPMWFPPEGIVFIGWLMGLLGSIMLGLSTTFWWAGLIAIVGIGLNYFLDLMGNMPVAAINVVIVAKCSTDFVIICLLRLFVLGWPLRQEIWFWGSLWYLSWEPNQH